MNIQLKINIQKKNYYLHNRFWSVQVYLRVEFKKLLSISQNKKGIQLDPNKFLFKKN